MRDHQPFFMVYGMGQRQPTVRHKSIGSATREAERLAREHPGIEFYVLVTVSVSRRVDVQTAPLVHKHFVDAMLHDDEIPF